jgi:uncharacterized protein (TIRG00374 family)
MEEKDKVMFTPSRIIFYALSLLVFYLGTKYIGKLKDIEVLLLRMNPLWFVLTLIAQICTYLLNSCILRILLKKEADRVGFFQLFKMSVVIMFVNQALPTGGISGNGYIFNQLVKRAVPVNRAFTVLVLESICYYIAFLLLLSVFYVWYLHNGLIVPPAVSYAVITGFVFYILLGIIVIILSDRRTVSFVLHKLRRFNRIRQYVEKNNFFVLNGGNKAATAIFAGNQTVILITILLQTGIIMCDVITVYTLMKGFHIFLPFHLITVGLLLSLAIGALPISPGSLIVYESAMTYFFTVLGLPVHQAFTITLLYRFFTFWLPIPAGLILYSNLNKIKKTG